MGPLTLGIGVVVLLVIVVRVLAPGVLVAMGTPLWVTGSAVTAGVGGVTGFFSDKQEVLAERDRLREEQATLYVTTQALEARVADLQKLLGTRTEPESAILAGVLARPPVSPYDVFILDQGTAAGVLVGAYVQGMGGMPIGVIESVTKNSARARLYSTPAQETEGWIGEDRIPVTLVGEGSGALSAVVAREAGIETGAQVYAAGPGAMPLGTVIGVENDPSLPRSRVDIRPLANPFSLTWVTILP